MWNNSRRKGRLSVSGYEFIVQMAKWSVLYKICPDYAFQVGQGIFPCEYDTVACAYHTFCEFIGIERMVYYVKRVEWMQIGRIRYEALTGIVLYTAWYIFRSYGVYHIFEALVADVFDKEIGYQKIGMRQLSVLRGQIDTKAR